MCYAVRSFCVIAGISLIVSILVQTSNAQLCETRNIDLAFVVDSSPKPNGSVWSSILTFVNLVIDQYIINDTSVRVAFVDYTDSAWIVFNLNNDYVNADRLKKAVGRVPQSGRANRSNLSAALDKVRTQVFHSSDARWKLAIVITDQLQSSAVLSAAVNNSRSASIRVYGVGIHVSGRRLDNAALYMLPWQSIGNSREAVWVNGYDELTSDTVRSLLAYTCVNSSVERRRPPTPKQPNQPEQTTAAGDTGPSPDCLRCICQVEGCERQVGKCRMDSDSLSCGPYQIKEEFWIDCGSPGENYTECTTQMECSQRCVRAYFRRYARTCTGTRSATCEDYARIHNGGPYGCQRDVTLPYWQRVQSCVPSTPTPAPSEAPYQNTPRSIFLQVLLAYCTVMLKHMFATSVV